MLLIYSIIIIVIVIIVCYKRYQIYHYHEYKFILLYFCMHWDEVKGIEKTWNLFHGWTAIHEINFKCVCFFCISCIIITKSKIHKFRYMKYKTNLRWTTLIFYIYVSIHYFLTKGICSKNVRQKLKVSLYGPEARLQLVFNILFEIIKFSIIGK